MRNASHFLNVHYWSCGCRFETCRVSASTRVCGNALQTLLGIGCSSLASSTRISQSQKSRLNDTGERLYFRTRVLQINHKHVYRKEFQKAFASSYSATHPSSIASITYRLGEITAEECDQFGRLSLLTRLTYECYCHAHSRKGYFRVLRQVFDHVAFLIECLSSNAGKIIAHVLVSHS
jgi:hypothetical protein